MYRHNVVPISDGDGVQEGKTGTCDETKLAAPAVNISGYVVLPRNEYAPLLHAVATLGLGAAVVNVIGDSTHGGWHSVVVGHAVLGVAMCFFAIYRFWQRHELVRTRHHGTAFGDRVGPLVV